MKTRYLFVTLILPSGGFAVRMIDDQDQ